MNLVVLSIINWLHLLATVIWIGGITTNILVVLPSVGKVLEPPMAGKFMGSVMKRFRPLIYASMILLGITGVIMGRFSKSDPGAMQFGNLWSIVGGIKLVVTVALIITAIYAFERLAPKLAKSAAEGPSPELARLKKLQMNLGLTGFILGMIIILLTGIMTAISSIS